MDYFGLWLSAEYGVGHSKAKPACTTYSSPMLSSSEEFEIHSVEVWGIGTPALPEVTCLASVCVCVCMCVCV